MHRASILLICVLLGACAGNLPEIRPSSSGFAGGGSVMHPLEDGKRHLAAGRNGLAIRRFGEELGRHPRSLAALNGLAIAYAGLGRHDVAQTYFERALEVDPRDAATLNNYGRSLLDQGRLRDARPFLEQALRYAGENDVTVVAGNMQRIEHPAPSRVFAALRDEAAQVGPRLVRVEADRYQLQTTAMPPGAAPTATAGVARRTAPLPIGGAPLALFAQRLPGPAEDRPTLIARIGDPPLPRMKPVRLPHPARDTQLALAPAARPEQVSPDGPATIRAMIERRVTDTGFCTVLDDIFALPAAAAGVSPVQLGEWS